MNSTVRCQLRVKCSGNDRTILDSNRIVLPLCKHCRVLTGSVDNWCANKDRWEWFIKTVNIEWCFKTIDLSTEGVSINCDINNIKRLNTIILRVTSSNNQSGACGKNRFSSFNVSLNFSIDSLPI